MCTTTRRQRRLGKLLCQYVSLARFTVISHVVHQAFRFVDRDMFMCYLGGSIGHSESTTTSAVPNNDFEDDAMDIEEDLGAGVDGTSSGDESEDESDSDEDDLDIEEEEDIDDEMDVRYNDLPLYPMEILPLCPIQGCLDPWRADPLYTDIVSSRGFLDDTQPFRPTSS